VTRVLSVVNGESEIKIIKIVIQAMLKNYFKIAWRNLLRDRQFSFLNLVGLSTGLACAFLIYLWVNDELSIDKFNKKDSQLYQVMKTSPGSDGSIQTFESTPAQLAQMMVNEMPERIQPPMMVRFRPILSPSHPWKT